MINETGVSPEIVLQLVREAAQRRRTADREFRTLVATARAAGISVGRIAAAAELSSSRVHAIAEEEQAKMSTLSGSDPQRGARTADDEVLVVAAGKVAVQDYLRYGAYICQPERSFRDVERMGFYRNGQIEPFFPSIRYRRQNVEFTHEGAEALRRDGGPLDAEMAEVIDRALIDPADNRKGYRLQVFLLTPVEDARTLNLPQPITHKTVGRGTAWCQGTRYTSEEALRRGPKTTAELG